jgi:hypothetical protein
MPTVSTSYVASLVTEQPQEETPVRDIVMSRDIATDEPDPQKPANATPETPHTTMSQHHTAELDQARPKLDQTPQLTPRLAALDQWSTTTDPRHAPIVQRVRIIEAAAPRSAYTLATDREVLIVFIRAAFVVAGLILLCMLA